MAQCAYCKTETQLYVSNVPVCIKCADSANREQMRASLLKKVADATMRADAASEAFQNVMSEIPSDMPHPDGVQRIKNAAHELSKARDHMMDAHRQLDDDINPAPKNRED